MGTFKPSYNMYKRYKRLEEYLKKYYSLESIKSEIENSDLMLTLIREQLCSACFIEGGKYHLRLIEFDIVVKKLKEKLNGN